MTDDGARLGIGRAARLAGVTAKALRHYDRIGLLRPAVVDPDTGYRRYTLAQVEAARQIGRLRGWDVPLAEVRRLLTLGREDYVAALVAHRRRLESRLVRTQRALHDLTHEIEGTHMDTEPPTAREPHLEYGKELFNHVWQLMAKEDRTAEEDVLMVHEAHASAYHWRQVGTPANHARSEWQCSRVYCVLRRPEPALYHARLVLEICERHGIGDWDLAFAYEALARAHAVAGDAAESARWLARAQAAAADIKEDDDRELLLSDLATVGA